MLQGLGMEGKQSWDTNNSRKILHKVSWDGSQKLIKILLTLIRVLSTANHAT